VGVKSPFWTQWGPVLSRLVQEHRRADGSPDWERVRGDFNRLAGREFTRKHLQEHVAYHGHVTDFPTSSAADVVEFNVKNRITSLDDLVALAKIDLDIWEVERWVSNKWEVGAKDANDNIVVEPLYQVKAWLRRKKSPGLDKLRADLVADIKREAKAYKPGPSKSAKQTGDHLLEIAPVDLHFGKLAWAEESGEDYDSGIADRVFRTAFDDLLAKASGFPVQSVCLVVGNDLMQVDSEAGTTTAGTHVDTDTRYAKVFRRARAAMAWAIRRAAEIGPVTVPIVPGNHDQMSAFHLGEVLSAEFHSNKHVRIDNRAAPRKYLRYGVTLLGFAHGHEEKDNDLPLIMAQERAPDWAATTFREFHLGHLHKSKETRYIAGDTFNGVRVRRLAALTATDAWHARKGYVKSLRQCEAFLFHFVDGPVGQFVSAPPRQEAA
jgi:hypothetical protein